MNNCRSYVNGIHNFAKGLVVVSSLTTLAYSTALAQDTVPWSHGISMHGEPALPADYPYLPTQIRMLLKVAVFLSVFKEHLTV